MSPAGGRTRLDDDEETSIDNLWMLTFSDSDVLESVERIASDDIYPVAGQPNKHTLRVRLSDGLNRIVMLANAGELDAFQIGENVRLGNLIWAGTDVAEKGTFADTPYRYAYKDGVRNHQYTWNELTGGTPGNTVAGYCPPDWRLPSQLEYSELVAAAPNPVWKKTYQDPADGSNVEGYELTIKTTGQKLFFSASGNNSGNVLGTRGYFWSSTQNDSTFGYALYFYGGLVETANDYYKVYTMSVRCVQDAPGTRAGVGDISNGQTYAQVMGALRGAMNDKLYKNGGAIPMWGEASVTVGGAAVPNVDILLHRAIARVDVGEGAWTKENGWAGLSNFKMTSVTVVKAQNAYSLIPNAANLAAADDPATTDVDERGTPIAPSPVGSAFSVEDSEARLTYAAEDDTPLVGKIYVPEAEIVDAALTDRMALVVGGKYQSDATPKYYRVDFRKPNGDLVDVVRNNLYRFAITAVNGPGSDDVETAYESQSSYMTVSVVGWAEVNFPTEIGR